MPVGESTPDEGYNCRNDDGSEQRNGVEIWFTGDMSMEHSDDQEDGDEAYNNGP